MSSGGACLPVVEKSRHRYHGDSLGSACLTSYKLSAFSPQFHSNTSSLSKKMSKVCLWYSSTSVLFLHYFFVILQMKAVFPIVYAPSKSKHCASLASELGRHLVRSPKPQNRADFCLNQTKRRLFWRKIYLFREE